MSQKLIAAAIVAAAAFAGNVGVAQAATYACKCDANFAANVAPGLQTSDFHLECRTNWAAGKPSNETDTGDYSNLVKATFPEAFPGDSVTSIRIRPRQTDQCVQGLYDEVNSHQEWGGINCNTSQNTSRDGFDIVVAKSGTSIRKMAGKAVLSTKNNAFLAFYNDNAAQGGKGYTLLAACVEPKT